MASAHARMVARKRAEKAARRERSRRRIPWMMACFVGALLTGAPKAQEHLPGVDEIGFVLMGGLVLLILADIFD